MSEKAAIRARVPEAGQLWTVRAIQTTALNGKPGTDYAIARWGGAPSPVLYSISLACANRIADELNALEVALTEARQKRDEWQATALELRDKHGN